MCLVSVGESNNESYWGEQTELVVMDQNGVIRRVIGNDEPPEDVALEVRELAMRIHRALNPELFPTEEPTQPARSNDSFLALEDGEPPAGHAQVLSRRRVGVPGPPAEPKPRPPSPPSAVSAPSVPPPRMSNPNSDRLRPVDSMNHSTENDGRRWHFSSIH